MRIYHIGFRLNDRIFWIGLIPCWILIVVILVCIDYGFGDVLSQIDSDSIEIILVFINIGWVLVVNLIIFNLRYQEKIIKNAHLRFAILITLNIFLLISGILIIILSSYDSTGTGIIIISVYLASKSILNIESITRRFSTNFLNIAEMIIIIIMVFVWMFIALYYVESK